MADQEEPKIIIDSDWKKQAQAEKERLAEASKAEAEEAGEGDLPKASITELVRLLASQAFMSMGSQDPRTGRVYVDLDLAQFNVDLLGVIEEKTKGNLSAEESQMLTQVLSELRMIFVETKKAVAQAMKEGKVQTAPAPGPQGQGRG